MGRKLQIRTSRDVLAAEALSSYFRSVTTPCGFGFLKDGEKGVGNQPRVWLGIGADPCLVGLERRTYIFWGGTF